MRSSQRTAATRGAKRQRDAYPRNESAPRALSTPSVIRTAYVAVQMPLGASPRRLRPRARGNRHHVGGCRLFVAAVCACATLALAATAQASEPANVPWETYLPALPASS